MSLLKAYKALDRMRESTKANIPFSFEYISCNETDATTDGLKKVQRALLRTGYSRSKGIKSQSLIAFTDADEASIAAEIYAESLKNSAVQVVARANSNHLIDALCATVSKGIKNGTISKRYSPADLAEWLLALIEGYIGRVATNPKLKHKHAALMAKKTVLQLLGDK